MSVIQTLLDWTGRLPLAEAAGLSLAVNLLVFGGALTLGAVLERVFGGRRVARKPPRITPLEVGLAAACVVLNSVVMVAGWLLFREGIVRVEGTAHAWRWLLDAAILLGVMDLAMYTTHRLAHLPVLFRLIHQVHHRFDQPRPLTLFVLHPAEVLGFGALWLSVLCLHTFSLGGMLLYLAVNTIFGVIGHVGVEPFPSGWVNWPLLRQVGTSTFHARHHQHPDYNYGFYTGIWDQLFGTLDGCYLRTFGHPPDDRGP